MGSDEQEEPLAPVAVTFTLRLEAELLNEAGHWDPKLEVAFPLQDKATEAGPVSGWADGAFETTFEVQVDEDYLVRLNAAPQLTITTEETWVPVTDEEKERDAPEHAEPAPLVLELSPLLMGDKELRWGLDNSGSGLVMPMSSLARLAVSVTASESILSEALAKKLCPVELHVSAVKGVPVPENRKRYKHVTVRYTLPCQEEALESPAFHASDNMKLRFRKAFLLGAGMDREEFVARIAVSPLTIELHDRDFIVPGGKEPVANERAVTVVEEHQDDSPCDMFGAAEFSLADLCWIESTTVKQRGDIQPIYVNKGKRANGYFGSYINLKMRTNARLQDVPDRIEYPFVRSIYIYRYDDNEITRILRDHVQTRNAEMLNMADQPLKALVSVELSEEQRAEDSGLDYISGVQVLDEKWRIVILEGLAKGESMPQLFEKIPKTYTAERRLLLNPRVTFKHRLYTDFHASVKNIKLSIELEKIANTKDIYMRSQVPEDCYQAFQHINQLMRLTELKTAKLGKVFPLVPQLVALEKKYGDFVSDQDIEGAGFKSETEKLLESYHPEEGTALDRTLRRMELAEAEQAAEAEREAEGQKSYLQSALDDVKVVEKVVVKQRNFVLENKKRYTTPKDVMEARKKEKEERLRLAAGGLPVYPYSQQRLNTQIRYKDALMSSEQRDPNYMYSYNPTFMDDCLLPEDEYKCTLDYHEREKTKTGFMDPKKKGLRYYQPKAPEEFNKHPDQLHDARVREMATFPWWQDQEIQRERPDPTLSAEGRFNPNPSPACHTFGLPDNPAWGISVFNRSECEHYEDYKTRRKDAEAAKAKLVVDDPIFRVHKKANYRTKVFDLDRNSSILHDEPKKMSLKYPKKRAHLAAHQPPPTSMFALEEPWVEPTMLKKEPHDKANWKYGPFNTNIMSETMREGANPKVVISKSVCPPVPDSEKTGPVWGRK